MVLVHQHSAPQSSVAVELLCFLRPRSPWAEYFSASTTFFQQSRPGHCVEVHFGEGHGNGQPLVAKPLAEPSLSSPPCGIGVFAKAQVVSVHKKTKATLVAENRTLFIFDLLYRVCAFSFPKQVENLIPPAAKKSRVRHFGDVGTEDSGGQVSQRPLSQKKNTKRTGMQKLLWFCGASVGMQRCRVFHGTYFPRRCRG